MHTLHQRAAAPSPQGELFDLPSTLQHVHLSLAIVLASDIPTSFSFDLKLQHRYERVLVINLTLVDVVDEAARHPHAVAPVPRRKLHVRMPHEVHHQRGLHGIIACRRMRQPCPAHERSIFCQRSVFVVHWIIVIPSLLSGICMVRWE